MTTVIDMQDPLARRYVVMTIMIGRLRIEAVTGMRHSGGSTLKAAQQQFGIKARTKLGALEELTALRNAEYPHLARTCQP